MRVYLDTSAVIKLLVEERGSAQTKDVVEVADLVAVSSIGYVEAVSALARIRESKRLSAGQHDERRPEIDRIWADAFVIGVDDAVVFQAARLSEVHALRAYDAVHLATASSMPDVPLFACWDERLRSAAAAEGLELV